MLNVDNNFNKTKNLYFIHNTKQYIYIKYNIRRCNKLLSFLVFPRLCVLTWKNKIKLRHGTKGKTISC